MAPLNLIVAVVLLILWSGPAGAGAHSLPGSRFFYSGNGRIDLSSRKNASTFSGRYRLAGGLYDPGAYSAICAVFGVPCNDGQRPVSLRLIEFIDYLQDHFDPDAGITITSGYRSPQYNTTIRKKGGLAAKASLHQYGMAADLIIAGVDPASIWRFVRALGFGGAGFYHGQTVHVDVGPARWWDETSSGVGSGISTDNKLIGMVCDYDLYQPGDRMILRFIRMTAFPIGVDPVFELFRQIGGDRNPVVLGFTPSFPVKAKDPCPRFGDMAQMAAIQWRLPPNLVPGQYAIRARFCGNDWRGMPAMVATPVFRITSSGPGRQAGGQITEKPVR